MKKEKTADWLTPKKAPKADAKPKKLTAKSLAEDLAKSEAEANKVYAGAIERIRKQAACSRKWLEGRGWTLAGGEADYTRRWRKRSPDQSPQPRTAEELNISAKDGPKRLRIIINPYKWSNKEEDTTAEEKASFDMYSTASAAVWFAERGEWHKALHFAWWAGFFGGNSNARYLQKEKNKKGGRRSQTRDEALRRLAQLEETRGVKLTNLTRTKIIDLDPWFDRLGKDQFRQILRAYRDRERT